MSEMKIGHESKVGSLLQAYWPVMVGAAMIAMAWGANTAQIGWIADGNKAILAKLDKLSDQQATFQATVAATSATENSLAGSVTDLRDRLGRLEARR